MRFAVRRMRGVNDQITDSVTLPAQVVETPAQPLKDEVEVTAPEVVDVVPSVEEEALSPVAQEESAEEPQVSEKKQFGKKKKN